MRFEIHYLGVNAVNVVFNVVNKELEVSAHSTGVTEVLSDVLNNHYYISWQNNYLPIEYKKVIQQSKYRENSVVEYDQKALKAEFHDLLKNKQITYSMNNPSRDFFSALYYLRECNKETGYIYLDANRCLWRTKYEYVKNEKLSTALGKVNTRKMHLTFEKLSSKPKEKSDMLTNNLVNEKNDLYFWFTEDSRNIPVKAEYQRSPFSVYWVLTGYSN